MQELPDISRVPVMRRFWAKVDLRFDGSCWEWTGGRGTGGYGTFWSGGKDGYAHRFSYEAFVGPIPEGLHIDHLCRNRGCVNPDHLEPVTPAENNHRCRRTHCGRGHLMKNENVYVNPKGKRRCRACTRILNQGRRSR